MTMMEMISQTLYRNQLKDFVIIKEDLDDILKIIKKSDIEYIIINPLLYYIYQTILRCNLLSMCMYYIMNF